MKFSDYLFFTQRLTCEDYIMLLIMQNRKALEQYYKDPKQKSEIHVAKAKGLEDFYRTPFGDVLINEQKVFEKMRAADPKVDLDSLLNEWRRWHVENLEPFCTYSLSTKIGKEMYNRRIEKKMVARHVASTFVGNGDTVCIPEGSSGTYVGLAIGLLYEKVTIVTSNEPLLREYRENPQFAPSFHEMLAIGGHVDDLIAHGGVSGPKCQEQFEKAIQKDPGATVVIMPVSGLLPDPGPHGLDDATCKLKEMLIRVSLGANVRALIFVTDYTKHLPSRMSSYGRPLFNRRGEWAQLLRDHRDRIRIVTAPPPELRRQTTLQPLVRQVSSPLDLSREEREYEEIAQTFARSTRKHEKSYECSFIEVFP